MKTIDEAAAHIFKSGVLERYKQITDSIIDSAPLLQAVIATTRDPHVTASDAMFKGIAYGVCVGIEMERNDREPGSGPSQQSAADPDAAAAQRGSALVAAILLERLGGRAQITREEVIAIQERAMNIRQLEFGFALELVPKP